MSEDVLAEYAVTLNRPKFKRLDHRKIDAALAVARSGQMAAVTVRLTDSPHEADNRFLECAEAARADVLITGNKRHFPKEWKVSRIVNAREFIDQTAILTLPNL